MSDALAARNFWPLILKLLHNERVLLAKLALRAAVEQRVDCVGIWRSAACTPKIALAASLGHESSATTFRAT